MLEKAKAVGLDLRGSRVANSEWRIYKRLTREDLSQEDMKIVEEKHLKKALNESSRSEGK